MFSLLSLDIDLEFYDELSLDELENMSRVGAREQAWYEAWYTVLRRHYGENLLPPFEVMQIYLNGNDNPLYQWSDSKQRERGHHHVSFDCLEADPKHLYISLTSADQLPTEFQISLDLIDFRPGFSLHIWFDHIEGKEDDSYLIYTLFLPLLQTLPAFNLTLQSLDVEVTYVNSKGLQIAPLERLLTELSLVKE